LPACNSTRLEIPLEIAACSMASSTMLPIAQIYSSHTWFGFILASTSVVISVTNISRYLRSSPSVTRFQVRREPSGCRHNIPEIPLIESLPWSGTLDLDYLFEYLLHRKIGM
jgi:hypothetical protein